LIVSDGAGDGGGGHPTTPGEPPPNQQILPTTNGKLKNTFIL